jgi:Rrf2 family protein
MKLSTKSTYGLRAMLNVALESDGNAVPISDISKNEGISVQYLEQLLNKLRHNGLIASVRGPKGGYVLSKDASKITVADIVKALEGEIRLSHCVSSGRLSGAACKKTRSCVPKIVWMKLSDAINDCLESMTLKDLCGEAKKIGGN